ncbi:MAG: ATP-binding protein [Anaerolineae bacterium]|nr:ATP-binding protein [Anaerolineae bacterium]NUQ06590.1 hypothetical protein [Anaerolineae bacterium]
MNPDSAASISEHLIALQASLGALQNRVATLEAAEAALRKTNQELERTLEDKEIELEATTDEFLRAQDDLERARADAERANRVKSSFLASMSHELRTPLNAIINFTKFVSAGDFGPVNDEQRNMLNEVVNNGKHLLSLINDVLDMSKIESGSLKLFIEENIDIRSLLATAVTTGEGLLTGKDVKIAAEISPDIPRIRGDRQRILQIFLNIISNACRFTEKGTIAIRASMQGDDVLVSVADNGPGIDEEDREAVFIAFRQTASGIRTTGGTGLGMPLTKTMVEAHGGKIWFESVVGEGTTFFVSLPTATTILVPTFAVQQGAATS